MILKLLKNSNLFKQFSVVSQLKFVNKKFNFSSKSVGILGVPLNKGQVSTFKEKISPKSNLLDSN